jgi:hypothetical protein
VEEQGEGVWIGNKSHEDWMAILPLCYHDVYGLLPQFSGYILLHIFSILIF